MPNIQGVLSQGVLIGQGMSMEKMFFRDTVIGYDINTVFGTAVGICKVLTVKFSRNDPILNTKKKQVPSHVNMSVKCY